LSGDDFDEDREEQYRMEAAADSAYEDFINEARKLQSEEAVQRYLRTYGDAIESRVQRCLEEAERLYELQFYGAALTAAVTAIELIIRFLLIRPLVSGAFLSEEWEELLAEKIGAGRSEGDREILPKLLKQWGFDLTTMTLPGGEPLWSSLMDKKTGVLEKRHAVVHRGEEATRSEASLAIVGARTILNNIVYQLATKLGFSLKDTGCWSTSGIKAMDPISRKPFEPVVSKRRAR
jgi:hypothetical protein